MSQMCAKQRAPLCHSPRPQGTSACVPELLGPLHAMMLLMTSATGAFFLAATFSSACSNASKEMRLDPFGFTCRWWVGGGDQVNRHLACAGTAAPVAVEPAPPRSPAPTAVKIRSASVELKPLQYSAASFIIFAKVRPSRPDT